MIRCNNCGHQNESGGAFCLNCGAALEDDRGRAPPNNAATAVAAINRVERSIYFSVARAVAWVLAIVTLLAMIYSAVGLVPAALQARAQAQSVTTSDLAAAVESYRAGNRQAWQSEPAEETYSAKELAGLDEAIYELVRLMPSDVLQDQGGVDGMRSYVKHGLRNIRLKDLDEQVDIVRSARKTIDGIPSVDRRQALDLYFAMSQERIQAAEVRASEGKTKFKLWATGFGISAIALMMVTMILVLMTIERNTRR